MLPGLLRPAIRLPWNSVPGRLQGGTALTILCEAVGRFCAFSTAFHRIHSRRTVGAQALAWWDPFALKTGWIAVTDTLWCER
jgi:hypothetical protein